MKLKAAITRGMPDEVVSAFGSSTFATDFLQMVVASCLGADNPTERPAEFYVQEPDRTVAVIGYPDLKYLGVELRLTGVSRSGRTPRQFYEALETLVALATHTIAKNLKEGRVQLFCVIMIDGDIETSPGSKVYSNTLESKAVWVEPE